MLKTIFDWIVYSSKDPVKLSLTLKAGVPFVVLFFGWTSFGPAINESITDEGVQAIVDTLVGAGQLIAGLIAVFGVGRKVLNTGTGK